MTVTVTAETLTEKQIKALRDTAFDVATDRLDFDLNLLCQCALGKRTSRRWTKQEARSRIAAILNAREESK